MEWHITTDNIYKDKAMVCGILYESVFCIIQYCTMHFTLDVPYTAFSFCSYVEILSGTVVSFSMILLYS